MASVLPSPPDSSSTAVSPALPSNASAITPPLDGSQPNQTSGASPPSSPLTSSAPPPQSPPPIAPPPPIASPPPPSSSSSSSSPPPLSPPPASPSPSPAPPPPQLTATPPPAANSPPPPIVSPPPSSSNDSPPPQQPSPALPVPVSPPPPPPAVSTPSSPPVSVSSPPPLIVSPPVLKPPDSAPPPPPTVSPPLTVFSPPPPSSLPPPVPTVSTPPAIPTSPLPPSVSPPAPRSNASLGNSPPSTPLPGIPTEKPTARSTTSNTDVAAGVPSRNDRGMKGGTVVAVGVVGFLAFSLVVLAVWFAKKRKKREAASKIGYTVPSPFASSQHSDSSFRRYQHSVRSAHHSAQRSNSGSNFIYSHEAGGIGNSRSWFTYEELSTATNNFSVNNLLGEGGFGCVYKGVMPDGREVAVKQLKAGGGQGEREFRAEVEIISRIHHRHLVSLVGYCISEYQRILVYDYVPNNTLHYHLHDEVRPPMDWATRIKVAAGSARGITYLHEDCNPRIIHRDIKSANILLDNNFEARVADFGLAKLAMELDAHTHVSTRVMGTFGYMAPEYATTGKLTEKSDVFSFGVVLLELITGRKSVDGSQPLGDESLVEWARPLLTQALEDENFEELVDPRLGANYIKSEMFRMIEAAAACIRHLASKRPRMSQVVRALDSLGEIGDITNGIKPGQSQIYDSRQQSAQIRMFQRMAFGSQDYSSDFFDKSQSSSSWRS